MYRQLRLEKVLHTDRGPKVFGKEITQVACLERMDKRGVIERQMEQREGCEDFVELWILHAGETDQVSIISTRAPIVSC